MAPASAFDADALMVPWLACLRERLPELRTFDCHTHLGADLDGSRQGGGELRQALDLVGGRAVAFPLACRGGYRGPTIGCSPPRPSPRVG
jgi:hypothetical protein